MKVKVILKIVVERKAPSSSTEDLAVKLERDSEKEVMLLSRESFLQRNPTRMSLDGTKWQVTTSIGGNLAQMP
jgi:hypothetical protein